MGNWEGFRELILVDKIKECADITSFYFKSKDGGDLIPHLAGQFLPLKINSNDSKYKEVLRTYSLSNYPNSNLYRISVKKIEGGLISSYLHYKFNVGDSISAMIPTGLFTISPEVKKSKRPISLLAGGIGITPLISMAYEEVKNHTDIYFVQAVLNSTMQPFKNDLEIMAKNNSIHNSVFYANPLETDQIGLDYNEKGFVTKDWIRENLPLNSEFYFCGPPPFMKALEKSLLELGVDQERIHYEFFTV